MAIIKEVEGDLIQMFMNDKIDFLVHGCNCFHAMGAGLALQVARHFPWAYEEDKNGTFGDIDKLGSWSIAKHPEKPKWVINAYTQYYMGRGLEYGALKRFLVKLNKRYGGNNYTFGFPLIGCGIAGGDWATVKDFIKKYTPDLDIVVVHFQRSPDTIRRYKEMLIEIENEKAKGKEGVGKEEANSKSQTS
jgi:O-acetyl-ADP-ribose deacetylase (regulator of RNase III)